RIQTRYAQWTRFAPAWHGIAPDKNSDFRIRLLPAARIDRALRLGDLGKTLFVILRVFFDCLFDLSEQPAMKYLFGDAVAQKEHGIGLAPVFAVFPDLNGIAPDLTGNFNQPGIVNVMAVAQEYLVVNRHQLSLQVVKRMRRRG